MAYPGYNNPAYSTRDIQHTGHTAYTAYGAFSKFVTNLWDTTGSNPDFHTKYYYDLSRGVHIENPAYSVSGIKGVRQWTGIQRIQQICHQFVGYDRI
jgi:hypothetical protein